MRYLPLNNQDRKDMLAKIGAGSIDDLYHDVPKAAWLDKPLDLPRFQNDVNAAVLKHVQLLDHPELVQRHAVIEQPSASESNSGLTQFVDRIKQLSNSWRRANR